MRIGIVEDAAGRPVGIITAKDLVEPLTGELVGL
jgi:CBS domain containing-hemolysin-like protein